MGSHECSALLQIVYDVMLLVVIFILCTYTIKSQIIILSVSTHAVIGQFSRPYSKNPALDIINILLTSFSGSVL